MRSRRKKVSTTKPRSLKYVDFEVGQEKWSKYKLEDDTILKCKFVLINVTTEKSLDKMIEEAKRKREKGVKIPFGIQGRNVIGVETPERLRGEPSGKYTPEELRSSIVKEDMNFEILEEHWNDYKLKNDMQLRIRNSTISVSRTSKFNSRGDPVYLVDSTADVKIKVPKIAKGKLKVTPM